MEVKDVWRILRGWFWLVVAGALISGVAALMISQRVPPTYEASATLLIHQPPASYTATGYNSIFTTDSLSRTIADIFPTRQLLQDVIANLSLNLDAEALAKRVNVNVNRETQIVVVTVEDSDPQRAANIANEVVRVFDAHNRDLQTQAFAATRRNLRQQIELSRAEIDRTQASIDAVRAAEPNAEQARLQQLLGQYQANYQSLLQSMGKLELAETQSTNIVSVVDSAQPPREPARPRPLLYGILAAIVGALLTAGAAVIFDFLDDSLRSSQDPERRLGLPILGVLPRSRRRGPRGGIVTADNPGSLAAESYRLLAGRIATVRLAGPPPTIAVISPGPDEGRSAAVANLAVALGQIGKRVIVVDANLRNPQLHAYFRSPSTYDEMRSLPAEGDWSAEDHLEQTPVGNVYLLPSSPTLSPAPHLLGVQLVRDLIRKLSTRAEVVIFDSPPALEAVDATLLANACHATVLFATIGSTQISDLTAARDQLARAQAQILGVIVSESPAPAIPFLSPKARPRNLVGGVRWLSRPGPSRAQPEPPMLLHRPAEDARRSLQPGGPTK